MWYPPANGQKKEVGRVPRTQEHGVAVGCLMRPLLDSSARSMSLGPILRLVAVV